MAARQEARDKSPCHLVTLSPRHPVTLSYFAFTALYLAVWFSVPKTRSTLPWLWLHDLGYKTLYYLQGLTYPLQPLALPLARWLGLSPLDEYARLSGEWTWPVVTALALIALIGLLILFARSRRLDISIFGLAWWAIAIAPMWPTLDWDYTWNGPRLHYIPALGTALIWGSAIGLLTTKNTKQNLLSAVKLLTGVVMFLVALAPGVLFLRAQADVVLTGGQIVSDVVSAVAAMPADEPALIINFPSWLSPAQPMYAIGAEGITFLPGYSTIAEMVEINTRQKRNVTSLTFTNVWKPWKHTQRFYTPPVSWDDLLPALHTAGRVFKVEYRPDGLQLREAGAIRPQAPGAKPLASFDERIHLVQANGARTAEQLTFELEWTSRHLVEADWTVYLHVYNAQGELIAQGDGDPLLGLYPLWAWQAGESVRDIRHIPLPPQLPPASYRVQLGIFDRSSGARIAVTDATGRQLDGVLLLEFEQ